MKVNDTNELIYETERDHRHRKQIHSDKGGEKVMKAGINYEFGISTYTLLYIKIDNQQDPIV